MYLRSNYRKDFISETRRNYDVYTKNSRHHHQSSNHNNSHINESGFSEGILLTYSRKVKSHKTDPRLPYERQASAQPFSASLPPQAAAT